MGRSGFYKIGKLEKESMSESFEEQTEALFFSVVWNSRSLA